MNPSQTILNVQENNFMHDQCRQEDRVVVGSRYKLLGLADWKDAWDPNMLHVFVSFSVVLLLFDCTH